MTQLNSIFPVLKELGLEIVSCHVASEDLNNSIADILAMRGARLLVHNGKPDIATKIRGRTAYEYMIDICLGKVGMQFDTGWCARGGEDPWTFIKRNESRIESLHYKDFNMKNDTDVDVCIGDGTLDNEIFMQFARLKGIPHSKLSCL